MEVENMIDRPNCEFLRLLFETHLDTRREWDRGFVRGGLSALVLAGHITVAESKALGQFFGVEA